MLATELNPAASGHFGDDVQLPDTARLELLGFIASELPRWRDHPDRKPVTAETDLTDQLCDHLNSAARHSAGWRRLQFRTEVSDEAGKGRKIDLAPKPCGATITIEGRRHTQFDSLLPIECKRLPIPKGKDRDEREYVISRYSSTGGIQRFKDGHHGSAHRLAGMIAYIQKGAVQEWHHQVSQWIAELQAGPQSGWSEYEDLQPVPDADEAVGQFHSNHSRQLGLSNISIRHLWIQMN